MGCNVICITPNRSQHIYLDSCIDNELRFCFLCTFECYVFLLFIIPFYFFNVLHVF